MRPRIVARAVAPRKRLLMLQGKVYLGGHDAPPSFYIARTFRGKKRVFQCDFPYYF